MNCPMGSVLLSRANSLPDRGSPEFGCWDKGCWERAVILSAAAAACGAVSHLLLQRRLLPWKALCSLHKSSVEQAERCLPTDGNAENRLFSENGISK